jgi:hypothetical protein
VEGGGYHLLLKARFNSQTEGYLILDTGASMSAFDTHSCEPFATDILQLSEIQSSGITSESLHARPVEMKKIFLGRYKFQIPQAVLIDISHVKHLYRQFANKNILGLLGGNFLMNHHAVIDYKKSQLKINQ